MTGKCFHFALETLFDLHTGLSSGAIVVGSNGAGLELASGAYRNETFPELGQSPELVHGFVKGSSGELKDVKLGHAWLEGNGYVLDCGSAEKRLALVPGEHFYSSWRIDPEECRRYTIEQATQQLIATGLVNCWHAPPPDVTHVACEFSLGPDSRSEAGIRGSRPSGAASDSMWSGPGERLL